MPFHKLAYVTPLVLVLGCGNNMKPFQPGGTGSTQDMSAMLIDGGGSTDLATRGDGAADGGRLATIDMAGFNLPGSPLVVINSPTATTEVQYDSLTVTATITSPSMTAIQSSSVQLTITPPNGGIVTVPMSLGAMANVYVGTIDISAIPSGMSTFSVSAVDIMNRKGSATGSYIHDHGPVITFLQPTAATAHGSITVELLVDDPLHPVTDPTKVSAYIHTAGDITLTQETGAMPMRLSAVIDFSKFNPPLDGLQIINATAINPKGTTTHASKQFTVDNTGPIITMTATEGPQPGSFVGGVVHITVDITDISGVSDMSVLAVFGNDPSHNAVPLTRTSPGSNTFQGFFDVRSLGRNYVLPELSITAADTLGNTSQLGEEIVVDNTPPAMTMDSKHQIYVYKVDANQQHECSQLFAPLGPFSPDPPEAAYNGAIMQQVIGLRARIQDQGNFAPGLLSVKYSGLVPGSIFLFAIHDDGKTPLAVDTDGNGVCDNVNPALVPATSAMMQGQALSLAMSGLTAGGSANYTIPNNPPSVPGCNYFGEAAFKTPAPLCLRAGTGLTFALPTTDPHVPSQIFSIAPVTSAPDGCVGLQLDSANTLPEGPTCVVTVATDQAGNTNVTAPLHICIDRHGGGSLGGSTDMAANPCAGWNTASPPTTCTGIWDKTQMKIVPGTCTPEPTFPDHEVDPAVP